jgi:hypothetical protein
MDNKDNMNNKDKIKNPVKSCTFKDGTFKDNKDNKDNMNNKDKIKNPVKSCTFKDGTFKDNKDNKDNMNNKDKIKNPVKSCTFKDKIISKFVAIKNFGSNMPDRTKIFLSAIVFWAYILYYMTKFINMCLCVFIDYTPDSFLIFRPKRNVDTKIPEILEAKINDNTDISNKLNMLLNCKWDEDVGDSGGIRVKDIVEKYKFISTSIVWISYLFEIDKKLESMSDVDIGKSIKYMLVNINEKVLYRDGDLKTPEDILFGEIPFD